MKEPFIFLCSEITRENALTLIHWLEDDEVRRFLSDSHNVTDSIAQVLDRVNLPVLTQLFNRDGRLYIAYDKQDVPVGFVRLVIKSTETEMVIVIGDRNNWGKRLGSGAIRESLKISFFELRTPKVVAKIHKDNKRSIRAFARAGFRLEREAPALSSYTITMGEYLKFLQGKGVGAGDIYITNEDEVRLKKLIEQKLCSTANADQSIADLDREINRAKVVRADTLAPDIVTMNSRALLHVNGKEMECSLVYPGQAEGTREGLSILSPIGTAILGYREGDDIEWETPSGGAAIRISRMLYQPEAAGDYHL